MAKGTYRLKREQVLQELSEVEPQWAEQLEALRSTNPQAFRKELLKADVLVAARLGRPTLLSMRPKRFGGDEDPVLARRVQELRKTFRQAEVKIALPSPRAPEVDATPAPGGKPGERGPKAESGDAPAAVGGKPGARGPVAVQGDAPPASGGKPGARGPVAVQGDAPAAVGGKPGARGPTPAAGDARPAAGGRPGVRGAVVGATDRESPAPRPSAPDLRAVLSGSVAEIKAALGSGSMDPHLDALDALERAGKARKGVLSAIAARR